MLTPGRALVLAMGEGQDAVFLAERGFEVEGCDISTVAVEKVRRLASKKGVAVQAFEADLEDYRLEPDRYDVIVCFNYLQRDLIPRIRAALRIGGTVLMETYTREHKRLGFEGPHRDEFLLNENELLEFFRGFKVVLFRERVVDGKKAVASIIAKKTADPL